MLVVPCVVTFRAYSLGLLVLPALPVAGFHYSVPCSFAHAGNPFSIHGALPLKHERSFLQQSMPNKGALSSRASAPHFSLVRRHTSRATRLSVRGGGEEAEDVAGDLRISVRGMRCGGCSSRVSKILEGTPGVQSAVVSLPASTAIVKYTRGALNPSDLVDQLTANGFPAETWEDQDAVQRFAKQEEIDRQEGLAWLRSLIIVSIVCLPSVLGPAGIAQALPPLWGLSGEVLLGLMQATVAICTAGVRFVRSGWHAVRAGYANMDVLVSVGVASAYAHSFGMLWVDPAHTMFQTVPTLLAIIVAGRFLEFNARRLTTGAIADIAAMQPQRAALVLGGKESTQTVEVDIRVVRPGDTVRVVAGNMIPVDGHVSEGGGLVDESMLTGEPYPVFKQAGSTVRAGTRLGNRGSLTVVTNATGAGTAVGAMLDLVQAAHADRAPVQRLADAAAAVLVPAVTVLAATVAGGWLVAGMQGWVGTSYFGQGVGPVTQAVLFGVSTLVVCCPCAMAIATPLAMVVGIGIGARHGVLFKSSGALEATAGLSHVCLDKTGTLTEGKATVVASVVLPVSTHHKDGVGPDWNLNGAGHDAESGLWRVVAAVEANSQHPLASVLASYAKEKLAGGEGEGRGGVEGAAEPEVSEVELVEGMGVRCRVGGRGAAVGSLQLMTRCEVDATSLQAARAASEEWEGEGRTVVWVAVEPEESPGDVSGSRGMECRAGIAVEDTVRSEAREVVQSLKEAGVGVVMLSGDSERAVAAVAAAVGIDDARGRLDPAGKVQAIKALQAAGARVGMVGDGVNDAAALAQADVGMAIGGGSGVAVGAAPVVLARLGSLRTATSLARATLRRVQFSLLWAGGYNLVSLPLAAGLLAGPLGLVASPCTCASLMSASSLVVVLSALSLTLFRPPPRVAAPTATQAAAESRAVLASSSAGSHRLPAAPQDSLRKCDDATGMIP